MGEKTLASANVGSYSPYDAQPLVGIININTIMKVYNKANVL